MASELRSILAEMRATRRARFAELERLPPERLDATSSWGRGPADVRFLLLRIVDHEEEHQMHIAGLLAGAGFRQTTAQRILAAAERTRGELLGVLVGLTDEDLDLAPVGEWPLRHTLEHILRSEERYLAATRYAVERFQSGDTTYAPPDESIYPPERSLDGRSLDEILALFDSVREHALAELTVLPDDSLAAPTIWANRDTDVNFRLLRFSHHEREHTAHIHKWRRQVGREPSEAQHLLGLAWQERGDLHGLLLGAGDEVLDISAGMFNGSELTIRRILRHIVGSEAYLIGQIENAEQRQSAP
jgi:hypothetical protein